MNELHPWIEIDRRGTTAVVRFTRKNILEETTIRITQEDLFRLVDDDHCRVLLVSFEGVENCSSYILGTLIRLQKRLRQVGGQLALCGLNPRLRQVFEETQLDQVFDLYSTEEEVWRGVEASPAPTVPSAQEGTHGTDRDRR
jgi:anti-anti-sigma factor